MTKISGVPSVQGLNQSLSFPILTPKMTMAKSNAYSPNSRYDLSNWRKSLFGTRANEGLVLEWQQHWIRHKVDDEVNTNTCVRPVERLIPARKAEISNASTPRAKNVLFSYVEAICSVLQCAPRWINVENIVLMRYFKYFKVGRDVWLQD